MSCFPSQQLTERKQRFIVGLRERDIYIYTKQQALHLRQQLRSSFTINISTQSLYQHKVQNKTLGYGLRNSNFMPFHASDFQNHQGSELTFLRFHVKDHQKHFKDPACLFVFAFQSEIQSKTNKSIDNCDVAKCRFSIQQKHHFAGNYFWTVSFLVPLPQGPLQCGGGTFVWFHRAVSDEESQAHSPPGLTQASVSAEMNAQTLKCESTAVRNNMFVSKCHLHCQT